MNPVPVTTFQKPTKPKPPTPTVETADRVAPRGQNIAELLHDLGYDAPGVEIDDTIRWLITEIHIRRQARPE